ncbi:MAG: hypothetical protein ACFB10_04275 [Salibacteraceae bacterium]
MKLYCISGLGADERVCQFLDLPDFEVIHMPFIPLLPGEGLVQYAHRMAETYRPEPGSWLMGTSFGGMLAQEVSHLIDFEQLVLVSTVTQRQEFRVLFRLADRLRLTEMLKPAWFSGPGPLARWFFTAHASPQREILDTILSELEPTYLNRAIPAIAGWHPKALSTPVLRLHGTADRIFPFHRIGPCAA